MDQNSKENLTKPESQAVPEQSEPGQLVSPETPPIPVEEGRDIVEQLPATEHESHETFSQGGGVYQMPPHDDPEEVQKHVEHIAPLPEEEKLWQLKLLARDHSLEKAIAVLKKMNDPWLEDKFHDDLMDDPEWRKQLEALGKIEKL